LRPAGSWTSYASNTSNTTLTLNTSNSQTTSLATTNAYDFRIRVYDQFYDLDNSGTFGATDDYAEGIVILNKGSVDLMVGNGRAAINKMWEQGTLDVGGEIYAVKSGGSTERVAMLSDVPSLSGYVQTTRNLTAGNGLTGGGTLAADRTFTLGTPGTTTLTSTNAVTSTSHTHAIDFGVIEETGSAGGETWVAYSDGTLVKEGSFTITAAVSTAFGNVFRGAELEYTFNTTRAFTRVPRVVVWPSDNTSNNRGTWIVGLNNPATTSFRYQQLSAISRASQVWVLSWIAVGKWK
jgi:hypothetical protein